MFVCLFCIFLSVVYNIGVREVGVGSARTPPSRERGAESHFRRGEPTQLSNYYPYFYYYMYVNY